MPATHPASPHPAGGTPIRNAPGIRYGLEPSDWSVDVWLGAEWAAGDAAGVGEDAGEVFAGESAVREVWGAGVGGGSSDAAAFGWFGCAGEFAGVVRGLSSGEDGG